MIDEQTITKTFQTLARHLHLPFDPKTAVYLWIGAHLGGGAVEMYNSVFQYPSFKFLGSKRPVFLPLKILPKQFERYFVGVLKHPQVSGLNITTPYKILVAEKAAAFEIVLDPIARRVGLGSCLYRETSKNKYSWLAGVPDGEGWCHAAETLLSNSTRSKTSLRHKRITIFGVGGAGRAILEALNRRHRKPDSITIVEPNRNRLKAAKELIKEIMPDVDLHLYAGESGAYASIRNSDILINATEHGKADRRTPLTNWRCIKRETYVFDLNWWPKARTPFLDNAKHQNAFIFNGLRMAININTIIMAKWLGIAHNKKVVKAMHDKMYYDTLKAGFREAENM